MIDLAQGERRTKGKITEDSVCSEIYSKGEGGVETSETYAKGEGGMETLPK